MKKKTVRPTLDDSHSRSAPRTVALQAFNCRYMEKGSDIPGFRSHLINISSPGAQIYSHKPLDEGTLLALDIWSKNGIESLEFSGKVVWARKNALKFMGRYAYGVHFLNPTPAHQAFVSANFTPEAAGEPL